MINHETRNDLSYNANYFSWMSISTFKGVLGCLMEIELPHCVLYMTLRTSPS
jgi:hypothetical protein